MVAVAATNSATPSLQSALLRSRVDAARREADRAESHAENLRQQADAQESVVQQARQRVKTVENAAQAQSTKPSGARVPTPQADPTYINALSEVFQAAKPILESGLSQVQIKIVESGLLETTGKATDASQVSTPSPVPYQTQVFQSPSQTIGRVLDATA